MKLTARAGKPVTLTVTDAEGFSATAKGAPPEAARTRPADRSAAPISSKRPAAHRFTPKR